MEITNKKTEKGLRDLFDQADPLVMLANDLIDAIYKVALVSDKDEDDNNIFPEKLKVIESMANAVEKMLQVSDELDSISDVFRPNKS